MPKLTTEIKKDIKQLSKTDLEKIVLKFAGRDRYFLGYLQVNFLNPEFGHLDLFDETKADIDKLIDKEYRGRTEAMQQTKRITATLKRVTEFTKIVKEPHLELELLIQILDYQFSLTPIRLGSYYQTYDNKLARLTKKTIELLSNKVHEDYFLEYSGRLNGFLQVLHTKIPYNKVVRDLPLQIPTL